MTMLSPWFLLVVLGQDPALGADAPAPAEVRQAFLKMLDRPRVAPDPKPGPAPEQIPDDLVGETWTIASEKKDDGSVERVPILIVRPKDDSKPRPAVIALHGTGGSKEGMRDWLIDLARRGIVGVAIDGRYHGDRIAGTPPTRDYNAAIVRAWQVPRGLPSEHPFYYDTCWDVWRTIDFLQERPGIDPNRIGLMGISKGGVETWLAGAFDDRVKVAVPCIGVQSFRWGIDNDRWQARARTIAAASEAVAKERGEEHVTSETCKALWDKVIPGILDRFDGPSTLRLFAGRPLLIINGEKDPNCPIEGAKLAFASAEAAFLAAGTPDRIKIDVGKGGHEVTKAQRVMILDWFVRWLKPM